MQYAVALGKKMPIAPIAMFILGLAIGLLFGYVLMPLELVDADPSYLRADLQQDYLRMAIDSYSINPANQGLAVDRWKGLGAGAEAAFSVIQSDPKNTNPAAIKDYHDLVIKIIAAEGGGQPSTTGSGSSIVKTITLGVGILVLLGVVGYVIWYLYRLLGKRGSGEVTVTMQAQEISRNAEKTNFEQLGLAPPITQTMTTYVLGDDLYDESFSIDTQAGEFMGEYGVGVSEAIGVGDPKKVAALEIWLFDKNDIKTATKVLMSRNAFNDPGIRARLEPKGELILVEPQSQILLETATLQLLATVVDLEYGKGPLPTDSYFERITLELAIWPRQG